MKNPDFAGNYIKPIGTLFLNLIKFVVVPIVIFSITAGVISMKDIRKVGAIGLKTVVYYMGTTAIAVLIGLGGATLAKGSFAILETSALTYEAPASISFMDTLINIFPSNFIAPMLNASMLQVIVIALLLGFGIILVGEKAGAAISFVLPLGATINMDGTAIYQGVCTVFIASCFGINLTLPQITTVVLTATLASVGSVCVPGSGMIMLAMVLESVGLPIEGIALVAGVDRIFDMGRTTVNITGDAACALVVSKLEEKRAS